MRQILILLFFSARLLGQTPPEYKLFVRQADSLYKNKEYKASAFKYSEAFKTMGWKGVPEDRYRAACAWALSGYPDSAFFNLERIASKVYFSDHARVIKDSALVSLHDMSRWKPLLEMIRLNQDTAGENFDRKLFKRLDSLVKEDQKWRHLMTRWRNGEIPPDSISQRIISDNVGVTDHKNLYEVRTIFYKYGFPNYDLVGRTGSFNFWLLVQHQDFNPYLQDSILRAMKVEAERGKASWSNYAYLVDRVKLNLGEKQIYGTQMQLNSGATSFEPRPLIEPEKVNERRQSVGLSPIEDYINVMNRNYHGSLKK